MKIFFYSLRDFDEKAILEELTEKFGIETASTSLTPSLENADLVRGADYVSIITSEIDAALIEKFRSLGIRMICTRSIGTDHIDAAAAKKAGIRISNSIYAPDCVADYAIMLMLMVNRKMKRIMQRADVQDYTLKGIQGINMKTQTVGVIGTGRIGRRVIASLHGFGCRILAYDLYENDEVKALADYVPLKDLISRSDIITLHMPLTDDNFHMINEQTIEAMKDGVRIINTARGGLIDSAALIKGLERGKIGGVGLDVVENEFDLYYFDLRDKPLDNEPLAILRSFPNAVVTPHMAFYTDTTVHDQVYSSVYACVQDNAGAENPYLQD